MAAAFTVAELVYAKDGIACLKVSKKQWTNAREIESTCNLVIADFRMSRMAELLDRSGPEG